MRLACSGLRDCFARNATLVLPSAVLAAAATQELSRFQLEGGHYSWQRPPIHSVETWLERCWQEMRYDQSGIPALLSPPQELLLWRQLIEQEHADLFDVNAAARGAREAARTIAQWHISLEAPGWLDHEDGSQFLKWLHRFEEICRQNGWMTRSYLWSRVPEWFTEGKLSTGEIVLLGFDEWPPALQAIRQASGAAKLAWDATPRGRPSQSSHAEPAQEVQAAARWARAAWERQPGHSLAVFFPELNEQRTLVERTFRNVFYPSSAMRGGVPPDDCIFHIDAAAQLYTEPLIASALLLLELANQRLDSSQAGAILRSPFIAGAIAERSLRADADLDLRRKREMDVSLRDLEYASRQCPLLSSTIWPSLRRVLYRSPAQAELADWSGFIADVLKALGWPGDSELDAREQALLDSWQSALSSLAALGMVAGEVSYRAALQHLRHLLSAPAQEVGDWSSPIQILNAADAAGLSCDQAFLTGLGEETWPVRERLSPFIPMAVQRAHGIPGSNPESARESALRRTRALFQSAPISIASFRGRLAPVVTPFLKATAPAPEIWQGKFPIDAYQPARLENIEDSTGPPYPVSVPIRGGASVLKSQSACPFRAFAEFRLNARAPEDACFGLDASARGSLLHKALELVWSEIASQDRLRALESEALTSLVRAAVNQAVTLREGFSEFQKQNREAEQERLTEIILEWLAIEGDRKHPFTIQTVEQERPCEVAGLQLGLRIDRIDRLENGKLVLIDYKSGAQERKKLDGQRPPEPQLLLYASTLGDEVEGVFFGQLKPRDLHPIGYSRHQQFSSKKVEVLADGWPERLAEWRETVDRLARDFVRGYAHVHPVSEACTYCRNGPLCRVAERSADDDS
ncbi:MAG TPA: PD-(D/E)XK nuclease family protein [Bryobacteraceae bacterium]|jgi:probable DNA repair protein|nr:PD-(D/E)XK nuclease family protein [Bryobacteraceae bacterium]